jgi:hypothetical protein
VELPLMQINRVMMVGDGRMRREKDPGASAKGPPTASWPHLGLGKLRRKPLDNPHEPAPHEQHAA